MCIAVPDTCILAESNQLVKYLSPSNSQTEALKQKPNATGLFVMQHKLVGHFWRVKQKNEKIVRACFTHEHLMEFSRCSLSTMYTKKWIPTYDLWTSVLC